MTARAALAAVLGILSGSAAGAQERPPLIPTRDALVEYQVRGPADRPPMSVQVHLSGGRIRAEPASLPGYLIVDRAADRAVVVMSQQHVFLEIPVETGLARDYLFNTRMTYVRRGDARIAGQPCTEWDVKAPEGRTAHACITTDGLVLRGEGNDPRYGSGRIEALSVTYAPQPDRLFRPPAGYQRLAVPMVPGSADNSSPR